VATTKNELAGIYSALPTPNDGSGGVATAPLKALLRFLVSQGVSGVVPVGGTGDYPALTHADRLKAVECSVDVAGNGIQVIAGVLSPGLGESVAAARDFAKAGASALMLITPYYVTPTQDGIVGYFRRIRDAVDVPLVLYDIPGRTGTGASPETLAALAGDGTIIGMKASSSDLYHFNRTVALCGEKMSILSGTDRMMPLHCTMGARGAVLTTASIVPAYWRKVLAECKAGRAEAAIEMQRRLFRMFDVFALEPLPVMLNAALSHLGLDMGAPRLPVLPAKANSLSAVGQLVDGLIEEGIVVRPI
jgi:4-hydroxy-tetrahydrodipicolinate synthase